MPAAAQASVTTYYSGTVGAGERKADLTRTTLNSSYVSSYCGNCQIWAGAHYAGGNYLYGTWAQGISNACKNYGVGNIGAMFEAPYSAQNIYVANAGWGSGNFC